MFVGDTVWDAQASGKAGVACVGVLTGGISAAELTEAGAAAVYDDCRALLRELEASPLAAIWSSPSTTLIRDVPGHRPPTRADVVISYLPSEEKDAQETARLIQEAGRRAVIVPSDLTEEKQCQRLVDRAVQEFGRIDILVNNAAYQMVQMGGIEDITTEQFDRVLKTNLYAMFWLCKQAIPHMRPGASIINTSSIQASQPSPELLDYATTKAGIVNFTRPRQDARRQGNPGKRGRAGTDLDTAHPGHHARVQSGIPRTGGSTRPGGTARRGRSRLRLLRLPGIQLRHC